MTSISIQSSKKSPDRLHGFLAWVLRVRTAVFSLFLHIILVLIVGGLVLYPAIEKVTDFAAGGSELVATTDDARLLPEAPPEQPSAPAEAPAVSTPETPSTTLDIVATASLQSNMQVQTSASHSSIGQIVNADALAAVAGSGKGASVIAGMGTGGRMGMGAGRFFGSMQRQESGALVGRFYDLKQTRTRKPSGVSPDEYHKIFRKFVREKWNPSILNDYFRAPKAVYATQIMIPNMSADEGPKAFEMEKEVQPSRWLVHYSARVSPPDTGVYRFVGAGDDVMVVRFNGKVVLDRCWYQADQEWQPRKNFDYGWTGIPNGFAQGDAIEVKAGQWYDIEILIGEQPGGLVFACLLLEKEGDHYQRDGRGNPILPVFRVADMPMPELQKGQTLPPYQPDGPVWRAQAPFR